MRKRAALAPPCSVGVVVERHHAQVRVIGRAHVRPDDADRARSPASIGSASIDASSALVLAQVEEVLPEDRQRARGTEPSEPLMSRLPRAPARGTTSSSGRAARVTEQIRAPAPTERVDHLGRLLRRSASITRSREPSASTSGANGQRRQRDGASGARLTVDADLQRRAPRGAAPSRGATARRRFLMTATRRAEPLHLGEVVRAEHDGAPLGGELGDGVAHRARGLRDRARRSARRGRCTFGSCTSVADDGELLPHALARSRRPARPRGPPSPKRSR